MNPRRFWRGTAIPFFLAVVTIACTGCSSFAWRTSAYTLATDRPVSLDRAKLELVKRQVWGETSRTYYFLPFGYLFGGDPACDEALRNALDSSGGDVLLNNVIIESNSRIFPFFHTYTIREQGDAYRINHNP